MNKKITLKLKKILNYFLVSLSLSYATTSYPQFIDLAINGYSVEHFDILDLETGTNIRKKINLSKLCLITNVNNDHNNKICTEDFKTNSENKHYLNFVLQHLYPKSSNFDILLNQYQLIEKGQEDKKFTIKELYTIALRKYCNFNPSEEIQEQINIKINKELKNLTDLLTKDEITASQFLNKKNKLNNELPELEDINNYECEDS